MEDKRFLLRYLAMVESEYVERVLIAIFSLFLRKITIKILLVQIRQIDNDLQIQLCQALTGILFSSFAQ